MPSGGHNAKPAELRLLEGNPGKRPIPKVPKGHPLTETPPEGLDREGRAEWRRVTKAWSREGVLLETDRATLFAYCLTWQTYVGTYRRGDVPSNGIMAQFVALVSRLGLSPVDRTRMSPKEEVREPDGIASILERKKQRTAARGGSG